MSSFTWSSRKYKPIYNDRKQISGCLRMVEERGGTEALQRDTRQLSWGGGDEYLYYLDCGDGFTGVCVCVCVCAYLCISIYLKLCSLLYVHFISTGLLKIHIAPSKQHCLQNCSPLLFHNAPQTFTENTGWECRNCCWWFTYPLSSSYLPHPKRHYPPQSLML